MYSVAQRFFSTCWFEKHCFLKINFLQLVDSGSQLLNYQRRRSNGGGDIASLPSVCMSLCQHDKTKTPDRNDLKLGTVVVLGSLWKPVDFSFKRSMSRDHHLEISAPPSYLKMDEASTNFKCCSQLHYGQLLPVNQKLCRNAMGVNRVIEYNSPWRIHPL